MAGIQLTIDTQLNTDGQTTADQPQAQLNKQPVRSQPTNTMGMQGQDQGYINQAKESGETMADKVLDAATDVARSAKDLAHHAATKTSEVVRGKHLKEQ
ncbi:hypothetical protein M8C21_030772 [Ambrosia artemisiifolia]|uniref:Uncharacterized protein n=1 Tax=Ambrosia artemisiifolia TaxID=4212 RepID=A0AAD5GPJ8_AMBAR|nr:hypothetical protein M8C21_030772 [Ambrosia artemisiifolia]